MKVSCQEVHCRGTRRLHGQSIGDKRTAFKLHLKTEGALKDASFDLLSGRK